MDNSRNRAPINRRAAMGVIAAGGAAVPLSMPAIAQGQPELNWRLTSSFPPALKGIFSGVSRFTERVAEATEGKFRIQYFAPGEIVGGLQALDAVRSGTVECCHTAPYFYVGQNPTFAFGTALPFGLNTRQHNTWLYRGGGLELLRAFFDQQDVAYVPLGNTCAQAAGWFRKEINTPADFQGLKMRIPGIGGQVFARLGGVPQQIAISDIYSALERGTIDAAELSGPYDDEGAGFHNVAPYYYFPGWQEVSAGTGLFIQKDKWEELPAHYQSIITAAAAEGEREIMSDYDVGNMAALRRLAAAGTQFKRFPAEVLEALYRESEAYYKETAESNADFAKIFENWSAFREDINRWFSIAETPNDAFIQRATRG